METFDHDNPDYAFCFEYAGCLWLSRPQQLPLLLRILPKEFAPAHACPADTGERRRASDQQ